MATKIWKQTLRISGGLVTTALLSGAVAVAQQQQSQSPTTPQQQTTTTEKRDTTQQQQQPSTTQSERSTTTTTTTGDSTQSPSGTSTQSPSSSQTSTSSSQSSTSSMAGGDIVETARQAGTFNTLVSLLETAGLADTLKGAGPFTVFAPTDDAFAKLPAGALADLSKPENKDKLKAILSYHVVPGKVMAADVAKLDGKTAKTVQGSELPVSTASGVKIGNATVSKADIAASNGVIHVVDTVLMPGGAGAKKGTMQ